MPIIGAWLLAAPYMLGICGDGMPPGLDIGNPNITLQWQHAPHFKNVSTVTRDIYIPHLFGPRTHFGTRISVERVPKFRYLSRKFKIAKKFVLFYLTFKNAY